MFGFFKQQQATPQATPQVSMAYAIGFEDGKAGISDNTYKNDSDRFDYWEGYSAGKETCVISDWVLSV